MIRSADLAIANLELTFGGKPYSGYPAFSAPDELLSAIRQAGFDVLMTANNHSLDKGQNGLERTIRKLDSLGITHTGTFSDTLNYLNEYPLIIDQKGLRLALLNYTYGTNGIRARPPNVVNMIDTVRIREDLGKAARQNADAIIVFFHWGEEYKQQPDETQRSLTDYCFKHGAKLVVGSHPHVIQPMFWDRERDRAVIYSLGNFVSGQRVRYRNGGALAHVTLQRIRDKLGIASLRITDVSYSLTWVYRTANPGRKFKLIPIGMPVDTMAVSGTATRSLMKEFVNDSRSFLDRENRSVQERARLKKEN
jgi:poly-gamma-glutamate synthesis protein (capsule biosynthesis protein)